MTKDHRLRVIVRWLKQHPIVGLLGVLSTAIGIVAGAPKAWQAVTWFAGLPECGSYSDAYYFYDGHFRKDGQNWTEYNNDGKIQFKELHRTRDYIVLLNQTPRTDPRARGMLVRLPACGGTAQWTYQNPEQWVNLFQVSRRGN